MPRAPSFCFDATPGVELGDVAAWVGAEVGGAITADRQWLDTFDWRLWNDEVVLEIDAGPGGVSAVLRDRSTHQASWTQRSTGGVPRLGTELPPGPWRRSLGALLGPRALIPVAAERVEVVPLNVVDANAKVVATAVWESSTRHGTLGRRVRVATVRGYETEARALADRLSAHSGLEATVRHPLELVTAGGRTPGEAPGRLTIPLEPELRADEAVRRILQHLYGTMLDNEPYLADAPDTEFLHDYRVALRRSRSALKQAKGVLAAGLLEEWRPVLADLQQRTGPLRDLDVFILEFESYRDAVPPEFSEDLQPLHALLRRKRTAAHRTLVRYLRSAGHDRLKDRYADFLVAFRPASPLDAPDGQRPVAEVASERIRRAFTRLVRRGRGVRHDSPSAAVHDLRIRGKELRYALELNGALFQPDQLDELVGRLKRLQDRLGTFQDAEVHATAMDGFADELARRGHAPVRSLMAIGLLSQYFREQQAEVRTEIADRFVAFNRKSTHKQVARVLGGATGAV